MTRGKKKEGLVWLEKRLHCAKAITEFARAPGQEEGRGTVTNWGAEGCNKYGGGDGQLGSGKGPFAFPDEGKSVSTFIISWRDSKMNKDFIVEGSSIFVGKGVHFVRETKSGFVRLKNSKERNRDVSPKEGRTEFT